jgi:hypothetical protein
VLVGQLELPLGHGDASTATSPDGSGMRWTSPGLARAASRAGRCLVRMTRAMARAFHAIAMAAPEGKGQLMLRALDEASGERDCAERDLREPAVVRVAC